MRKTLQSLLLILLLTVFISPALAQESATSTPELQIDQPKKVEIIQNKKGKLEKVKTKQEEIKAKIAEKKDKIKVVVEKRKGALKEKLLTFKDKRKASTAGIVSDNLTKINEQRTNKMSEQIVKMNEILTKLETRLNTTNNNTAQTAAAITTAKTAINISQNAIETQAGKNYITTVNSETTAKSDLQNMRNILHTDLKTVHQTLVTAHQALAKAISATKGTAQKPETYLPKGQ